MDFDITEKLSPPRIYDGDNMTEQLRQALDCFYNGFLKKDVKPSLMGKNIFFQMAREYGPFTLPFPERFLHIVSIEDAEKYDIPMCTNDQSYINCTNKCDSNSNYHYFSIMNRAECLYRLARIHWIKEIIDLANLNDKAVQIWEEYEKDHPKRYDKLLVRYKSTAIDYLLVFKKRSDDILFITAYPVCKKSSMKKCDDSYERYKKEKGQVSNET